MYQLIMSRIQKQLGEGFVWLIESVGSHYINVAEYVPNGRSSYIELPEEVENSKKRLINIKNLNDKDDLDGFQLNIQIL